MEAVLRNPNSPALRGAMQSLWSSVLKGMAKESAEEVPDELFSQISSALAKDPNASITEVFARFIENSPELLAAIALTGGGMEGKQAWSENQRLGQTPPTLPENQTPNASNPATDASTETPNQNPPPRPPLTKEDVAELEKSQSQYDTNDKTPEDRLQQVRAEFPDRTSPEDHALFQNLAEKYDPLALDANQPLSLMTQAKLRPGMEVPGVEGNTARINGLPPEAPALPKGGLIRGSALEQWADKAIANARGNMNMGLDPVVMSAYSVKGAALIESGVRAFADWSQQMVKDFGEGIRPHLQELWERASGHTKVIDAQTTKQPPGMRLSSDSAIRLEESDTNSAEADVAGISKSRHLTGNTRDSIDYKLDTYLLNSGHPKGGPKSVWFRKALGFTRENAGELAKQLVFDPAKATPTVKTQYGQKFDQIIDITGANGKTIPVEVTWIKNPDGVMRIVTAVPANKRP